jgi:hypothetical protein
MPWLLQIRRDRPSISFYLAHADKPDLAASFTFFGCLHGMEAHGDDGNGARLYFVQMMTCSPKFGGALFSFIQFSVRELTYRYMVQTLQSLSRCIGRHEEVATLCIIFILRTIDAIISPV